MSQTYECFYLNTNGSSRTLDLAAYRRLVLLTPLSCQLIRHA
jgi:hypothetical protein